LIAWKSKQQGGVTLSTSEAEYYALSEVATELLFVKQIMVFLEVNMELPMLVKIHNIEAIHLANNAVSGSKTKHVDTLIHFVRDLVESKPKILETEFVGTAENQSDTFTKIVTGDVFWKHTMNYMEDLGEELDPIQKDHPTGRMSKYLSVES
jgi:hypothetical protein